MEQWGEVGEKGFEVATEVTASADWGGEMSAVVLYVSIGFLFVLVGIPLSCFALWVAMHCVKWVIDEWQRLFG